MTRRSHFPVAVSHKASQPESPLIKNRFAIRASRGSRARKSSRCDGFSYLSTHRTYCLDADGRSEGKKKSGEQRNMLRRLIFMGQQFSSFFVNSLIDFLSSSSSYRFFSVLPLVLVAYENKIIEGTGHLFFFHHAFTRNFHFPTWHYDYNIEK